jgi:hypothetical protein
MPCLPAALLLIGIVAGCGGSSVPEGDPFAVRLDVLPGFFGSAQGVRAPQPLTVSMIGDVEWGRVSRLLPDPLPEPLDQGRGCASGHMVSVQLVTRDGFAGEISYGPCRRPEEIEPVRRLLQTLLRRRLAAERRCECP